MPRNTAGEVEAQRPESNERPRWPEIGINAVAAASLCKSNDRRSRDRDAWQTAHLFDDTDFATD